MDSTTAYVHTTLKHYQIYAIYNQERKYIHISSSTAKHLNTTLRSHANSRNKWTANFFGTGNGRVTPKLSVLETLICTPQEAHLHVLAWHYYFHLQGYLLLSTSSFEADIKSKKPSVQKVYTEVCEPLLQVDVLSSTQSINDGPDLKQLNLRVKSDVIASFRGYCQRTGKTQSEAIRSLLMAHDETCESELAGSYESTIREKDDRIRTLEAEVLQLRKRLAGETQLQRCIRWSHIINAMLQYIIDMPRGNPEINLDTYQYAKQAYQIGAYHYPLEQGAMCVKLLHMVQGDTQHGKHAAIFILCETDDGEKIKVRYYPRAEYVGIPPTVSADAYSESEWIIGYEISKDGAANLIASIPCKGTKTATKTTNALEHIINTANRRKSK